MYTPILPYLEQTSGSEISKAPDYGHEHFLRYTTRSLVHALWKEKCFSLLFSEIYPFHAYLYSIIFGTNIGLRNMYRRLLTRSMKFLANTARGHVSPLGKAKCFLNPTF
jgi:hypothetical protein